MQKMENACRECNLRLRPSSNMGLGSQSGNSRGGAPNGITLAKRQHSEGQATHHRHSAGTILHSMTGKDNFGITGTGTGTDTGTRRQTQNGSKLWRAALSTPPYTSEGDEVCRGAHSEIYKARLSPGGIPARPFILQFEFEATSLPRLPSSPLWRLQPRLALDRKADESTRLSSTIDR